MEQVDNAFLRREGKLRLPKIHWYSYVFTNEYGYSCYHTRRGRLANWFSSSVDSISNFFISPLQACLIYLKRSSIVVKQMPVKLGKISSTVLISWETGETDRTFLTTAFTDSSFPQTPYEVDESGQANSHDLATGTVKPGVLFSNNGFWDTFPAPPFPLALNIRNTNTAFLKHFQ